VVPLLVSYPATSALSVTTVSPLIGQWFAAALNPARVVEGAGILCAQFEQPRERRCEPRLGPAIDLLPQQRRY
jgi:hypothetical protein